MSVFAWSDLHTDYDKNLERIAALSEFDFQNDTLLLAGDISHHAKVVENTFRLLTRRFRHVFFVPGNHDLWLYKEDHGDSLKKFAALMTLCDDSGIGHQPRTLDDQGQEILIVPLFSWYRRPEHGSDSLFIPKAGEDASLRIWLDNYRIHWPAPLTERVMPEHFAQLNTLPEPQGRIVISMSHFLPHGHLMFQGEPLPAITAPLPHDPHPAFNFSRVAGSTLILDQIHRLQSNVHVYGHQHRNRWRLIQDRWFVSHCLGYPDEPQLTETGDRHLPLRIWPQPGPTLEDPALKDSTPQ